LPFLVFAGFTGIRKVLFEEADVGGSRGRWEEVEVVEMLGADMEE
jgi:hypothetical protein